MYTYRLLKREAQCSMFLYLDSCKGHEKGICFGTQTKSWHPQQITPWCILSVRALQQCILLMSLSSLLFIPRLLKYSIMFCSDHSEKDKIDMGNHILWFAQKKSGPILNMFQALMLDAAEKQTATVLRIGSRHLIPLLLIGAILNANKYNSKNLMPASH